MSWFSPSAGVTWVFSWMGIASDWMAKVLGLHHRGCVKQKVHLHCMLGIRIAKHCALLESRMASIQVLTYGERIEALSPPLLRLLLSSSER